MKKEYARLLAIARRLIPYDWDMAKTVGEEAWELKLRFRIKTNAFDQCRRCHIPWVPGETAKVIYSRGRIIWRCKACGYERTRWWKHAPIHHGH